jgi:hypothetical protein
MKKTKFCALSTLILVAVLALPGCIAKKDSAATDATTGGTFTTSDIIGSGSTACTPGTSGLAGAAYYVGHIDFTAGGNFNYTQLWYTNSSCTAGMWTHYYNVIGTYAVGGVVTGALQSISFHVTSTYLAPYTNANTTFFNAGHCSGGGFVTGVLKNTMMVICDFVTMANAGAATIDNVVGYSGGVLSLGAGSEGIPGVFAGGTVPASATITY